MRILIPIAAAAMNSGRSNGANNRRWNDDRWNGKWRIHHRRHEQRHVDWHHRSGKSSDQYGRFDYIDGSAECIEGPGPYAGLDIAIRGAWFDDVGNSERYHGHRYGG